jgi:hypothetical protein
MVEAGRKRLVAGTAGEDNGLVDVLVVGSAADLVAHSVGIAGDKDYTAVDSGCWMQGVMLAGLHDTDIEDP